MLICRSDTISISVPADAGIVMRFAAEELRRYLVATLNVSFADDCEKRFVLCIDPTLAGKEALKIEITEDTVTLAGSEDGDGCNRGILYAVYEFLEKYAGCSFAAYSHPEAKAGEIIPALETLELAAGTYEKAAHLPYRTAIVQFDFWVGNADRGLTLPFIDWLAKNRYNRILTWAGCYEQLTDLGLMPEIEKRGLRMTVGHHQALSTWLPPFGNRYFPTAYAKEHPEYYRLQEDGTRFLPTAADDYNGQLLLCCHNEECVRTLADNILSWLAQNPVVDVIALWPHDGSAKVCACPDCAPLSKTENYLHFENAVAELIRAKCPDVKIDVLIYQDFWECPENVVFADNIIIDQATWPKSGLRHCGKPDGSALLGTDIEKNLLSYRKKGAETVLYDYYMGNFGSRQRLMPAADEMQSIFRSFRSHGIAGSGTQMECFNHWNNLFNFYCFARTAYDTDLSFDDSLTAFVRLFGEGAEEIKEILRICEQTLDGQEPINKSGIYLIEHIDLDRIYNLYESALAKAQAPVCRNNIRLLRMVFRYSHLFTTDPNRAEEIRKVELLDPTNELAFMATHFDSYYANHTGYGIAIPVQNRTAATAPDHWYAFDK